MTRARLLAAVHACLLLGASAAAEPARVGDTLPPRTLADQHGEAREIGPQVRLLLFAADMDGGKLIREALAGETPETLASRGVAYVANIAGMPRLVARFFAIPAMRRRGYPVLLDRDGSATADLPGAEGRATAIALEALTVTAVTQTDSADAVRALLPPLLTAPDSAGHH